MRRTHQLPRNPQAVLLPNSTEQVQAWLRICSRKKDSICRARFRTGLSGGALPDQSGIVISLARMNRILEVDIAKCASRGGTRSHQCRGYRTSFSNGYFYAPDPSSQSVCSIGGNVAENSGGAHCLKYGFTTTHVLGLEVVITGWIAGALGGKALDRPGYDLSGNFRWIGRHAGHRNPNHSSDR